jgi:peptidoglycan hydrolase CwlO-like protein
MDDEHENRFTIPPTNVAAIVRASVDAMYFYNQPPATVIFPEVDAVMEILKDSKYTFMYPTDEKVISEYQASEEIVKAQDDTINDLEEDLARVTSLLDDNEKVLQEKIKEIEDLEAQIAELKKDIAGELGG